MPNICPICGYAGLHKPAYDKSNGPSYEICRCCFFEYGYDDDDQGYTHEQWRQKWIDGGMIWRKGKEQPPLNWDAKKQLLNIGVKI